MQTLFKGKNLFGQGFTQVPSNKYRLSDPEQAAQDVAKAELPLAKLIFFNFRFYFITLITRRITLLIKINKIK